jgi:alanine racemase
MTQPAHFREAVIDLAAIFANVSHLRSVVGTRHTLVVVKANGYGHGAVPVARTALAAGADWLGVAELPEAFELRAAGIDAPILAWLHGPNADFAAAIDARIDLGLSSLQQLNQAADAASRLGVTAEVQLKLETGLSRNGASEAAWSHLFDRAAALQTAGIVHVRGLFSHLSNASPDDDAEALASFERGLAAARAAGLTPELVHLASTSAALRYEAARFSMVRLGIGIYGLSPFADASSSDLGLVPAMTLCGQVAAVRRVPAGAGVSYDYTWRAAEESDLALVPFGYADGIPRSASGQARVSINGTERAIVGRVAMDQFVVDLGAVAAEGAASGAGAVAVGDTVILFGDPTTGVPSATDWADAAGTINYEIVTRIGARVTRRYLPAPGVADAPHSAVQDAPHAAPTQET